jgi:DNA-binding transcriptional ArsR family regulator
MAHLGSPTTSSHCISLRIPWALRSVWWRLLARVPQSSGDSCHFRLLGILTGKSRLAYTERMSDVFEAIATPVRRAILDELVERDGQTLFELCTRLIMKHQMGLTRQAISQHLAVLESAGLVTTVRQGKYKLHYLHTEPLRPIVERWLQSDNEGGP